MSHTLWQNNVLVYAELRALLTTVAGDEGIKVHVTLLRPITGLTIGK